MDMVKMFEIDGKYQVDRSMYCGFKYIGEQKWVKNDDSTNFPFSMKQINDNKKHAFTVNITMCPFKNND